MKKHLLLIIALVVLSISFTVSFSHVFATSALDDSAGVDVSEQALDELNPLKNPQPGDDPNVAKDLATPGGIVTRFITVFAFPLAGLILFVMLLWGGFEMMSGAVDKKSLDAGKQRVTAALVGFLLLFVSYWFAQILELVFGITIV